MPATTSQPMKWAIADFHLDSLTCYTLTKTRDRFLENFGGGYAGKPLIDTYTRRTAACLFCFCSSVLQPSTPLASHVEESIRSTPSFPAIMTEIAPRLLLLLLFAFLQSILVVVHCQPNVVTSTTTATTEAQLRAAQHAINNGSPYWYRAHSNTKNVFRYGLLKKELGDVSALVYPFLLMTYELGNRLGNYFTEVACAEAAGVHFIAVHKSFDTANSVQANSTSQLIPGKPFFNGSTLLDALPDIIIHPNPSSREEAIKKMDKYCTCTRYCWGNGNAPWINRTSSIGTILRRAIQVNDLPFLVIFEYLPSFFNIIPV